MLQLDNWPLILSGSADRTIRIWKSISTNFNDYQCVDVLHGHQGSVNCIATQKGRAVFVSGSSDATLSIWRIHASDKGVQTSLTMKVVLKPRVIPLAVALHSMGNGDHFVLAVSGTRNDVLLYILTGAECETELVTTLSGHEGWVRSLDIVLEGNDDDSDLLLASASQDKYIRVWRIHKDAGPASSPIAQNLALTSNFRRQQISGKATQFVYSGGRSTISFEALLTGHEDWVHAALWNSRGMQRRLLSASADNSLAIWEPEASSGIWTCTARLGEVSVQKGATTATGSFGGLWLGLWGPRGNSVAALGRTGSWRRWVYQEAGDAWIQRDGVSGHFKGVSGLAWAKDGRYLLSTSLDQTTRVHACLVQDSQRFWHEIARAQIHGYDMTCIDTLKENMFVSGAEEKILRVFVEPRSAAALLASMSRGKAPGLSYTDPVAIIPMLGLSNKSVEENNQSELLASQDAEDAFTPAFQRDLGNLPDEDLLARHTLWPEIEKLYGHGYEISAVATSHGGDLIASACRSSSLEHSVVRLFETETWREIKPALAAHSLTVNHLCFSHDDQYLLSVGRDRQYVVFRRESAASQSYRVFVANLKGHSRMILGAAWAPFSGRRVFTTAGRDKLIKIWELVENSSEARATILTSSSVRSVDFHQCIFQGRIFLAYGTEDGDVSICSIDSESFSILRKQNIEQRQAKIGADSKARSP